MADQLGIWPALDRGMKSPIGGNDATLHILGTSHIEAVIDRVAYLNCDAQCPLTQGDAGNKLKGTSREYRRNSLCLFLRYVTADDFFPKRVHDLGNNQIGRVERGWPS